MSDQRTMRKFLDLIDERDAARAAQILAEARLARALDALRHTRSIDGGVVNRDGTIRHDADCRAGRDGHDRTCRGCRQVESDEHYRQRLALVEELST